jgi:hypothetical protein
VVKGVLDKRKSKVIPIKKAARKGCRKGMSKNDEFYTPFPIIECEIPAYKEHFKDKVVYLNCDDSSESQFYLYFFVYFEYFGIKKLISTHYDPEKRSYKMEVVSDTDNNGKVNKLKETKTILQGNGDFRSLECLEILKEADIVVTNPPFSLFSEHLAQLIENDKKFIIIGNQNAITYSKAIFTLIKDNKLWFGHSLNGRGIDYRIPDSSEVWKKMDDDGAKYAEVGCSAWFTNLDHKKRSKELNLRNIYDGNEHMYPEYDHCMAIDISRVIYIPRDFPGPMGVPLTFLHKYNPNQFEIIDAFKKNSLLDGITEETRGKTLTDVNGETKYSRIIIQRRKYDATDTPNVPSTTSRASADQPMRGQKNDSPIEQRFQQAFTEAESSNIKKSHDGGTVENILVIFDRFGNLVQNHNPNEIVLSLLEQELKSSEDSESIINRIIEESTANKFVFYQQDDDPNQIYRKLDVNEVRSLLKGVVIQLKFAIPVIDLVPREKGISTDEITSKNVVLGCGARFRDSAYNWFHELMKNSFAEYKSIGKGESWKKKETVKRIYSTAIDDGFIFFSVKKDTNKNDVLVPIDKEGMLKRIPRIFTFMSYEKRNGIR